MVVLGITGTIFLTTGTVTFLIVTFLTGVIFLTTGMFFGAVVAFGVMLFFTGVAFDAAKTGTLLNPNKETKIAKKIYFI